MSETSTFAPRFLSASEYVLALHEPQHQVSVLVRNRGRERNTQRILPAEAIASAPFQAWLKEQNEAGADIYVTWNAAALFLEGKKNLLRLQQDIPLTEAEANAVEDGVNAFAKLLAQLTDVPTPAGPTPRQLQSGLLQIEPTKERRE
jgi:hypothetical protein